MGFGLQKHRFCIARWVLSQAKTTCFSLKNTKFSEIVAVFRFPMPSEAIFRFYFTTSGNVKLPPIILIFLFTSFYFVTTRQMPLYYTEKSSFLMLETEFHYIK